MPQRQCIAVILCRTVSIASPPLVIHTHVMKTLTSAVFLLLCLGWSTPSFSVPGLGFDKQALIDQATTWVAEQTSVSEQQVMIKATDRRLKIPTCASLFDIAFLYPTSQETIRVICPDTGWKVYVGVKITRYVKALAFVNDLVKGDIVTEQDIELVNLNNNVAATLEDRSSVIGMALKTPVSRGDLVFRYLLDKTQTVFKLQRDILRGEMITTGDISVVEIPIRKTTDLNRFPLKLLSEATASRDLVAGEILTRSDLNIKQMVMISTRMIQKGERINADNARLSPFFGKLPSDVLTKAIGEAPVRVRRTIQADQPIRESDLQESSIVNKGDSVILIIRKGLLEISTPMVAKEDGEINDQIILINPESNEEVKGIITGPGKASGL